VLVDVQGRRRREAQTAPATARIDVGQHEENDERDGREPEEQQRPAQTTRFSA
jgi:hypothetical protein